MQILDEAFQGTSIKYNLFPQVNVFDAFFNEKNIELRQKTKKLKIQLKLCPGVEPPLIKRVQIETYKMIKKPYTEWNTFSEEETIEVDKDPACVMIPLIHRLFSMLTERKVHIVTYYAPVGWEITRINAYVVDGNYKNTTIKRTLCRENKGMVEIEVSYPRVTREMVWFKTRLEGVISRKRIQDVKIPEIKDIIVVCDEYGEHELPEGIIDTDDLE